MPRGLYIIFIILLATTYITAQSHHNRRTLHQPFFPIVATPPSPLPPPPTTQPPFPSPQPQPSTPHHHQHHQKQPEYPFSSLGPPNSQNDFFPNYPSSPSQPSPSSTSTSTSNSLPTFPANISSIILPPSSSSSSKPISRKLVITAAIVSVISVAVTALVAASLLYHHRHKHIHPKLQKSDSLHLFPPDTPTSDKPPPPPPPPPTLPPRNPLHNSSEFLYLGTLSNKDIHFSNAGASASSASAYQKLGSPELHPLPPLPRHNNFRQHYQDSETGSLEDKEEEEFFSPRASPVAKGSPRINDRSSDSPSPTLTMSTSPTMSSSAAERNPSDFQSTPAVRVPNFSRQQYVPVKLPPVPPPMPPAGFWDPVVEPAAPVTGPPVLAPPTRPQLVLQKTPTTAAAENSERKEEIQKPKLKALHWDKVGASSERPMAWDHFKSSSFQLNEEMFESLFMVNSSNLKPKDGSKPRVFVPTMRNGENRVLDQKKSQNVAILLRALNVTIDEVCEGLLEGNIDMLGTELLESLLKMAPTKEEECKLKEFNDSSSFNLGPAERFLKALLDVPFAFKRINAMLYIANFDSEVEYLNRSFETLESACEELKKSRMFLKLLDAVLQTGNRMNVGTNWGDAHAFKLDTLLKLVDIKGTDGKTTLLHFVVQEITRAEGSDISVPARNPTADIEIDQQSAFRDDVEFRKLGLQVVSGLSGELSRVKKAAAMDSDVLSSEVGKLATSINKIGEVLRLNEELGSTTSGRKFSESMNGFLKKAEKNIIKIQAQESVALTKVKEITEYFHGNSAREEAHPFRIFTVVRDFLSVLDQVCKEVGKINERTLISSARPFPFQMPPLGQSLPSAFPQFQEKQQYSSSDDEISISP